MHSTSSSTPGPDDAAGAGLKELLLEALEREREGQAELLRAARSRDPAQAERLEALLVAHQRAEELLRQGLPGDLSHLAARMCELARRLEERAEARISGGGALRPGDCGAGADAPRARPRAAGDPG